MSAILSKRDKASCYVRVKGFNMKNFLILILLTFELFALEANTLLLRAQASIFPKIILLDKEIQEKKENGLITLEIFYSSDQKSDAKKLKELIDAEHDGQIGSNPFEVKLTSVDEPFQERNASAYYFFDLKDEATKKFLLNAKQNRRISFAYDYRDFEHNALIGLILKEKTYIYLNKESLSMYNINFVPIFYKIVKVK